VGELSVVRVSSAAGVSVEAGAKAVGVRVLSGGGSVPVGPAGICGTHAAKSRVAMYKKYSKVLLFIFNSYKLVVAAHFITY
jgi:hypothetical protein